MAVCVIAAVVGTAVFFFARDDDTARTAPSTAGSKSATGLPKSRVGDIRLVSTGVDGVQGDGDSSRPAWSPDGARIVFTSDATNLVPGDTNGWGDVFVKDLRSGAVTIVSAAADGTQGDGSSYSTGGFWSPDGTRIAFTSEAANLVPGDTNGQSDVFVKTVR